MGTTSKEVSTTTVTTDGPEGRLTEIGDMTVA
jgi:hypothetical protein